MLRSRPLVLASSLLVAAACSESPIAPAHEAVPAGFAGTANAWTPGMRKLHVTSTADAGAGTLRAALTEATADASVRAIAVAEGLGAITLASPLAYAGVQPLDIDGGGNVVDASGLSTGNAITLAAHRAVSVRRIVVMNAPAVGLAVLVPNDAGDEVSVLLAEVTASGNGLHGVLINDQAEYLADPNSTSSAGSPAGLRVDIARSRFVHNGFALIDSDGLRINEGGAGDLVAVLRELEVVENGGDGVELDERGEGGAIFTITHSDLLRNGSFTAEDYDDGIDVDEADGGDLRGRFIHVKANDNFEQGVDLNENGAGHLVVTMTDVEGSRNAEEGIEFEEDDDVAGGGDIVADLANIVANGNGANDGDAGLKLREKGDGNVDARINGVEAYGNAIGGVEVREDAAGTLVAALRRIVASGNDGHGVKFDENGSGDLAGKLVSATTSDNQRAGVQAEQAAAGTGALTILVLTAAGNVDGAVAANASQVSVTRQP